MRTTFTGGSVVTGQGVLPRDVFVEEGVIVAIAEPGHTSGAGGQTIDCDGLLILPGMIDTHVHLMDPGPTEREDFPTGTRAAAARGTTTIVEHTHGHPIRTVDDLAEKTAYLEGRSNVDYGLAAHVWPEQIPILGDLWRAGVSFFKLFTCTTHGVPGLDETTLRTALEAIGTAGGRVLIHCEDEEMTSEAEGQLRAAGRDDPGLLIEWRNRSAEELAVARTASLARITGVKTVIAHVSTPRVLDIIEESRVLGGDIVAEACPQYFALDEADVHTEGPFRKFTPPARIRSDTERAAMWEALRSGRFSHVSTDHAPSTVDQKGVGSIWDAPFGLPGLDTTYPFLIDAALTETIDLPTMVKLSASAAADHYGLAGKGRIAVGYDADLALVDPAGSWTVERSDIISKAGWSPYEGRTFRGRIVATYLRGREIAVDGVAHDQRTGRFVSGAGR